MTTTPTEADPPPLRPRDINDLVHERVHDLQNRFLNTEYQDPAAVAALARLRRGVGKNPEDVLGLFEYTAIVVPENAGDEPTPQERAVHVAMTLFALHQQSRGERMHRPGHGLGSALRSLHTGDQKSLPDPLTRRFRMLGTTDSFPELVHHLRGAVQLLRTESKPLDYGLLAGELVVWQLYGPDQVKLAWGRGFYRTPRTTAPDPA